MTTHAVGISIHSCWSILSKMSIFQKKKILRQAKKKKKKNIAKCDLYMGYKRRQDKLHMRGPRCQNSQTKISKQLL